MNQFFHNKRIDMLNQYKIKAISNHFIKYYILKKKNGKILLNIYIMITI